MIETKKGIITKGIGGFYYVEVAEKVYECKARGAFRKKNIKPIAGDYVDISIDEGTFTIEKIYKRKTHLIRPAIANAEQLIIVVSTCDPRPNIYNIDKMTAFAYQNNIEPIIVISKIDIESSDEMIKIYNKSNIKLIEFSSVTGTGIKEISDILKGKISVFAGNSGVGKSTILNTLYKNLHLEIGATSKKLGRGKHTTRTVELYRLDFGGYVADTPGFSSIDILKYGIVDKSKLIDLFPDLKPYTNKCKFVSCTHTCEKGCELIQALEEDKISKSRHNSYANMYNELKLIKKWDLK